MSLVAKINEALEFATFTNSTVEDTLKQLIRYLDEELDEAMYNPTSEMLEYHSRLQIAMNMASLESEDGEEKEEILATEEVILENDDDDDSA